MQSICWFRLWKKFMLIMHLNMLCLWDAYNCFMQQTTRNIALNPWIWDIFEIIITIECRFFIHILTKLIHVFSDILGLILMYGMYCGTIYSLSCKVSSQKHMIVLMPEKYLENNMEHHLVNYSLCTSYPKSQQSWQRGSLHFEQPNSEFLHVVIFISFAPPLTFS